MSGDFLEYDYYEPKKLSSVLQPGDGSFKIISCEPKVGKKPPHNKMLHIVMRVRDVNSKELNVDEYLVATPGDEAGMKRLATKIRNIANAIGNPGLYGPGVKLAPRDLVGERGKCIVKTESRDDFPDRSVITKYIPAVDNGNPPDDDCPF